MGITYQIKNQSAIYFMTYQVVGWADVFSRKIYRDMVLNSFSFCRKNKGFILHAYVIMTNHIHIIARAKNNNLSDIVRDNKKFISKQIMNEILTNNKESRRDWLEMIFKYHAKNNKRSNDMQFWTHDNHAVELFDDKKFKSKIEYIHQNPVKAGWVINPEDYLYSSARNYADIDALIEIDIV